MEESLFNVKQEIKRADHLIYVTLKYTRTVDTFRHIIDRMINALDFTMDVLLKQAKKKRKLKELPTSPGMKAEQTKALFDADEKINAMVDFYLFLRKLMRAKYTRDREYRRHVTMTSEIDAGVVELNIDKIHEYFNNLKDYVAYVEKLVFGENES